MQTSHQSRRSNLTRKKDFSEILQDLFLFTFFSFLNSFFFFGKGSQVAGVEFNFIRSSFFTISYWWNIQRGELETRPYWMRISASWLPVSEYINVRNKSKKSHLPVFLYRVHVKEQYNPSRKNRSVPSLSGPHSHIPSFTGFKIYLLSK